MQEGILIMEVDIVQETCCECNISFWMTAVHQKHLIECKNDFFCPNGHSQHYSGETDAEKLKRTEQYLEDARSREDAANRSNSALRGVITRMKKKES